MDWLHVMHQRGWSVEMKHGARADGRLLCTVSTARLDWRIDLIGNRDGRRVDTELGRLSHSLTHCLGLVAPLCNRQMWLPLVEWRTSPSLSLSLSLQLAFPINIIARYTYAGACTISHHKTLQSQQSIQEGKLTSRRFAIHYLGLKVGFHYQTSRLENSARELG